MSEVPVKLSPSERDLLVRLLGAELKQKRVEVHRTEFSREFRHHVEAEETLIDELLAKISQAAEVG
jgi:hypothetical protein